MSTPVDVAGRSQGTVEKKSTMPILSHVLLEVK
jgi:hypothetical protein